MNVTLPGPHAYNSYLKSTPGSSFQFNGTSEEYNMGATDPFANVNSLDFRLQSATTTGKVLTSPYNKDPYGIPYGTDGIWDRGAYEYSKTNIRFSISPSPVPAGSMLPNPLTKNYLGNTKVYNVIGNPINYTNHTGTYFIVPTGGDVQRLTVIQ
jgi:hypothetical protein